jgi:predicted phage baseplate assembly protein
VTPTMAPACGDERRRGDARAKGVNGIDSISVSSDQLHIAVTLFGKIPEGLAPQNIRIDGGTQVVGIQVVDLTPCPDQDPEESDCLQVVVDQPGDWSCYRLSIVQVDPHGRPGTAPYAGFDQRYYCCDFSFKQNCGGQPDCGTAGCGCGASEVVEGPVIDYLARDYSSLRQELLDRLSLTVPDWTERHEADVGITLVELLAYAGDLLNYRLDAAGTEAYLDTARLRTSLRRHARLVDYRMHDGCAARAFAFVQAPADLTLTAGTFRFRAGDEVFEPLVLDDVPLRLSHNEIHLWTWGDAQCCLMAGATDVTLVDDSLGLEPGDLLVFEEVVGAHTGLPADADRSHRQVVRLVAVEQVHDDLYDQALLRVSWAREDALSFALCVNARTGPTCADTVVGVARGNLVAVGHGASATWCGGKPERPSWPAAPPTELRCACPDDFGCPHYAAAPSPSYPPRRLRRTVRLGSMPVTREVPFPDPRRVASGQADVIACIPDQARARLAAMLTQESLSEEDLAYLATVFGADALKQYAVAADPQTGLRSLLGRFEHLLAAKLARLDTLCRRARSGYVLTAANEGVELQWSWAVGASIDPGQPRLRGPASAICHLDPRLALAAATVTADGDTWRPDLDLLSSGPTDRTFVAECDDDGVTWLRFGDGRTGLAPAAGTTLEVAYKVGNGPAGNVGAESIDTVEFCGVAIDGLKVRNPVAACGGTAPETLAAVRQNAPREALRVLRRAVTAADYATVAGTLTGVQRAGCELRWTGSWYEAEVAIDALSVETAPPWLIAAERELLHRYRRIGHDIVVRTANEASLELGLCVQVDPAYITDHVRAAILTRLGAQQLADGSLGYFHPDNLTFGSSIRISSIVATVSALPGVAGVAVTQLRRQFDATAGTAVEDGVLELSPTEIARLDNDPTSPDHGLLQLTVGGGR